MMIKINWYFDGKFRSYYKSLFLKQNEVETFTFIGMANRSKQQTLTQLHGGWGNSMTVRYISL